MPGVQSRLDRIIDDAPPRSRLDRIIDDEEEAPQETLNDRRLKKATTPAPGKPHYVEGRSRKPKEAPGSIEHYGAAALGGISGAVESSASMLGRLGTAGLNALGADIKYEPMPAADAAKALQSSLGVAQDPTRSGEFGTKLASGVGSTIGMGLQTLALGPAGAAAGLGAKGAAVAGSAATGALTNAGMAFEETLATTGDEGKAWESAGWNALIGTTEAADALAAFGTARAARGLIDGAKLAGINKKLGGALKDILFGSALEGLQEGSQQAASALVDSKLTGAEKDYLREFVDAAKLGGAIGAVLGGGGFVVRGTSGVVTKFGKPLTDGGSVDAKSAPNLVPNQPGGPKGNSGLNVPGSGEVLPSVLGAGEDAEVLGSVVGPHAVDVVDNLVTPQASSEDALHHEPMLADLASVEVEGSVAAGREKAGSAVGRIAGVGAESSGAPGLTRGAGKAAPAGGAVEGAHGDSLSEHPATVQLKELETLTADMDRLAKGAKNARLRGDGETAAAIDSERIKKLMRQQELAIEMQVGVAERAAAEKGGGTPSTPEEDAAQTLRIASKFLKIGQTKEVMPDGDERYFDFPDASASEKQLTAEEAEYESRPFATEADREAKLEERREKINQEMAAKVTDEDRVDYDRGLKEFKASHPELSRADATIQYAKEYSTKLPERFSKGGGAELTAAAQEEFARGMERRSRDVSVTEDRRGAAKAEPKTVYHGSPHTFESFSTEAAGTGTGISAVGAGVNVTSDKAIGDFYRDMLAERAGTKGTTYEAKLNVRDEEMLDFDKPLALQSPEVLAALAKVDPRIAEAMANPSGPEGYRLTRFTGQLFLDNLAAHTTGGQKGAADALKNAGVKGIRYKAGELAASDPNATNYIVFDPTLLEITRGAALEAMIDQGVPPAQAVAVAGEEAKKTDAASKRNGGEPPGPPKPPAPEEEIPDGKSLAADDIVNRWIGDRQLSQANAQIKASRRKKALKATLRQSISERLAEQRLPKSQHAATKLDRALYARIDTTGKIDQEFGKFGDSLTAEQKQTLELAAALSPEQIAIADEIVQDNAAIGASLAEEGVIANTVENYTKRIWRKLGKALAEGDKTRTGKFRTFTTGALPRSYSSVLEGWANGDQLAINGAVDAAMQNEIVTSQVVLDRNLMKSLQKVGQLSATQQPGWQAVEHPNFKSWTPLATITIPGSAEELVGPMEKAVEQQIPLAEITKVYGWSKEGKDSTVLGRGLLIRSDGNAITILHKTPQYAPAELARDLNNILGTSAIHKLMEEPSLHGKVAKAYDRVNATIRAAIFMTTSDNHIAATIKFLLGSPLEGVKDINPVHVYKTGWKEIEDFGPRIQRLIRDGGMRIEPAPEWTEYLNGEQTRIGQMIDKIPVASGFKNLAMNVWQDQTHFMFSRVLPSFKAHTALLEQRRLEYAARDQIKRGEVSLQQVDEAAARLANNLQGGQNMMRARRNPTAQHAARWVIFAPDWTESSIRLASDAFKAGAVGQAHRIMWQRAAARYTVMWAAFNFASAWVDDKEHPVANYRKRMEAAWDKGLIKFFGWDVTPFLAMGGRKSPTRLYLDITSNISEPVELMNDPVAFVNRKMAVVPRMAIQALTGMDRLGRRFTSLSELLGIDDRGTYKNTVYGHHVAGMEKGGKLGGKTADYRSAAEPGPINYTQVPSYLTAQASASLPIPGQAIIDTMAGQMDGYEAMLRSIGFRVSRAKEPEKPMAMKRLGL